MILVKLVELAELSSEPFKAEPVKLWLSDWLLKKKNSEEFERNISGMRDPQGKTEWCADVAAAGPAWASPLSLVSRFAVAGRLVTWVPSRYSRSLKPS